MWAATSGTEPSSVATVAYREIRSLSVGGPGAVTSTSGGGWIGGGYGVTGALEGAAMATFLNVLTTRTNTTIQTLVHLNAGARDLVILNQTVTPMQLETRLSPVFARIEDARPVALRHGETIDPGDPISQLERLALLRDRGIVTGEEFDAMKAAILQRLSGG